MCGGDATPAKGSRWVLEMARTRHDVDDGGGAGAGAVVVVPRPPPEHAGRVAGAAPGVMGTDRTSLGSLGVIGTGALACAVSHGSTVVV